jgi:hypothetical protein
LFVRVSCIKNSVSSEKVMQGAVGIFGFLQQFTPPTLYDEKLFKWNILKICMKHCSLVTCCLHNCNFFIVYLNWFFFCNTASEFNFTYFSRMWRIKKGNIQIPLKFFLSKFSLRLLVDMFLLFLEKAIKIKVLCFF